MSNRPAGRRRRTNLLFVIMAVAVSALMIAGTLAALLPVGDGTDEPASGDEPAIQVTPGAEVAKLETRVAADPSDVDTIIVLADVLSNSGRVAESYAWYEKAVGLRPDDADLRLAFGRALLRGEQWFDAELQLTRADELAPANATTAFYMGQLAEERPGGDPNAAIEWYRRVIERDPDSLVAQQARTRLSELGADAASPDATPGG